jgi:cytochrome c oxidase subunit 2
MERIDSFNNGMLILVTLITLFVVALLAIVLIRYRAKVNPVPSKTTHNTVVEVLWTVIPVLILVGIAIPSFGLLFAQYDPARIIDDYDPESAINIKVTGQTWVWQYAYPDHGIRTFTSGPILDAEATAEADRPVYAGEPRLLETTLPMVVPVDTVVRLQVTSDPNGVLHAFSLNAMGVKLDAVPGRVTESWFLAEREGTFYGQCSELCGRYHYAMPIELRVVSQDQFDEWVAVAATDINAAKELLDTWEAERLEQVAAR